MSLIEILFSLPNSSNISNTSDYVQGTTGKVKERLEIDILDRVL
jgi:hypothetical protein